MSPSQCLMKRGVPDERPLLSPLSTRGHPELLRNNERRSSTRPSFKACLVDSNVHGTRRARRFGKSGHTPAGSAYCGEHCDPVDSGA
jgi:hypothetical protein